LAVFKTGIIPLFPGGNFLRQGTQIQLLKNIIGLVELAALKVVKFSDSLAK
jgi:hypothetical protein